MNNQNKQYISVGVFVVMASTVLFIIWLWMSANTRENFSTYITIFHEPLDGLSVGALVKYSGVEVGKVQKITLDTKNPRNITVNLNIYPNIPINKLTTASMKSAGVTGISYIELDLPSNVPLNDNLISTNTPPFPVINSKSSLLYNLTENAQNVVANINQISNQTKKMLSQGNIEDVTEIIQNLNKITKTLANNSENISSTLKSFTQISANLNQTVDKINNLSDKLITVTNHTNKLIDNFNQNTMGNINYIILPNLNNTITQLNKTSQEFETLLNTINQNPSVLVRGLEPPSPGPGEKQ